MLSSARLEGVHQPLIEREPTPPRSFRQRCQFFLEGCALVAKIPERLLIATVRWCSREISNRTGYGLEAAANTIIISNIALQALVISKVVLVELVEIDGHDPLAIARYDANIFTVCGLLIPSITNLFSLAAALAHHPCTALRRQQSSPCIQRAGTKVFSIERASCVLIRTNLIANCIMVLIAMTIHLKPDSRTLMDQVSMDRGNVAYLSIGWTTSLILATKVNCFLKEHHLLAHPPVEDAPDQYDLLQG